MKWHAHRDWAGWSFGWYPTRPGQVTFWLQKINWYCIKLAVWSVTVRFTYKRNPLEEAYRRHDGLPPTPRLMIKR
jgi:hypothetical protein